MLTHTFYWHTVGPPIAAGGHNFFFVFWMCICGSLGTATHFRGPTIRMILASFAAVLLCRALSLHKLPGAVPPQGPPGDRSGCRRQHRVGHHPLLAAHQLQRRGAGHRSKSIHSGGAHRSLFLLLISLDLLLGVFGVCLAIGHVWFHRQAHNYAGIDFRHGTVVPVE